MKLHFNIARVLFYARPGAIYNCANWQGEILHMMNKFKEYGFIADTDKAEFNRVFNNGSFDKIHVDVYMDDKYNQYMLLSRMVYENVKGCIEDNRVVLFKGENILSNVIIDAIEDCMVKIYGESLYEFVFKIRDVCYKSLVHIIK